MRQLSETLVTIMFTILLIAAAIAWRMFTWGECRMVGHSILYCLFNAGN